jgi:mannitol/fructose-specific phosphotransferase system IIA component (Ntr-type)
LQLTDLLTIEHIRIPLHSGSKEDVLRELVDVAMDGIAGADQDDVLRAVQHREAVLSTGIGYGVAVPHGKTGAMASLRMAAGRSVAPIPFDAHDGQPVQLFFLLVGPEAAAGPHIKALSRISRLVRRDEVRSRLLDAPDARAFLDALSDAED